MRAKADKKAKGGEVLAPHVLRQSGVEVFSGLFLFPAALPQGTTVSGPFEAPKDTLEFGYILRGRGKAQGLGDSRSVSLEMPPDTMVLRRPPGGKGHFQLSSDDDLALLGLEFTNEAAENHLAPHMDTRAGRHLISAPITAQERSLAWQLMEAGQACRFGPLYMQGLVLQLLAVSMNHVGGAQAAGRENGTRCVCRSERRKVLAARELLDACMETSADLEFVAAEVGLSPTRLKASFRNVIGQTPFRYLHEQKLHHSRTLMEQEGCSVSQAAWRIGYTNVSHFSAAFRRQFAVLPGELLGRGGQTSPAWDAP